MDYFIIIVTTIAGLYFHWWLYVRIKRWVDRDLALSLAGTDEQKKQFMLQQLAEAQRQKVKRRDLPQWLEQWLAKAVSADPHQRFETAEQCLLQLEHGEHQGERLRPRPLLEREPLKVWRGLALLSLLFNLILLIALLKG